MAIKPSAVLAGPLIPTQVAGAAAATRYVGGTASGAPASGAFLLGDFVVDQTGAIWICTVAGSPGTWVKVGSGGGFANPMTAPADLITGGTAGAPERLAAASFGDYLGVAADNPQGAVELDGVSGNVQLYALPAGHPTSVSFAIWLRPTGAGTPEHGYVAIVARGESGGVPANIWLGFPSSTAPGGALEFLVGSGSVLSGSDAVPDTWQLAVCTWDGTNLHLYLGPGKGSGTPTPTTSTGSGPASNVHQSLGASEDNNDMFYEGDLAEYVLSNNVVWTGAEIDALFAAATQTDWNSAVTALAPTAWYHLDETSGTTAVDSSGHSYNGSYAGGHTLDQPGPLGALPPSLEWQTLFEQGALLTTPHNSPTTTAVTSGAAWQNAYGYDVTLRVPVTYNPTASAAATLEVGVGPTATPTQALEESEPISFTAGVIHTKVVYVPAGWYALLTVANGTLGTATVVPV